MILGVIAALSLASTGSASTSHHAKRSPYAGKPSRKKAIWGPLQLPNGRSAFPTYRELGVGIYQMSLVWPQAAPTRPVNPTDPTDPAYHWPASIDQAVAEAHKNGIQVLVMLHGFPGWSNGGKDSTWAPDNIGDFTNFVTAASKRYPGVKYWLVLGEPCKGINFHPLVGERKGQQGKPLDAKQRKGPELYARMLDGAYGALKRVQRSDYVIGGNCFTGTTATTLTDVSPLNWMRYMRLPNGKPPRMDLYGHNPVTARRPDLKRRQIYPGTADFSDLDVFERWVSRYIDRPRHKKRPTPIFISEFWLPTDHFGAEANFYLTRQTAASWTRSALRIVRHDKRLWSFGWLQLLDEPPNTSGDEKTYGLLDYKGRKKPAFDAYRDG